MDSSRRFAGLRLRRAAEPPIDPWVGHTSFDESFRMIRSNLEVALSEVEHPSIIVTSSKANEGKTIVCIDLALSFAEAGYRVILVDLDLRRPCAHSLLRTHNELGVSDVLLGTRPLQDCLQTVQLGADARAARTIYFLPAGPEVHNPTELLGTRRTTQMLEGLSQQADLVLIDTAPVLPVADTLVIARAVSGALLVVESRATAMAAVKQSKDLLIRNQTRMLGIVMNKFKARDASGYGYGYYPYGYGYGDGPASGRRPRRAEESSAPRRSAGEDLAPPRGSANGSGAAS
jgi:capsular exopolysaccharide synthesis family protein